MLIYNLKMKNI